MIPDNYSEMLRCMEKYGGGFAASLAVAWQKANLTNKKRLEAAFPELMKQYSEMAKACC